ncbi:MAG: 3-oxoacyl-[acyl-carrier-protein] reductase [Candidatus Algichlamydia australiensis]|nr:3-oxoacyl-[acyl-carrier-protein] reductase [Chlamydiales bacterium]
MKRLEGKRALVTGGTSGIGKAIALKFAEAGADVTILGTNKERAEATLKELKEISSTQNFSAKIVNLSQPEEIRALAKEIEIDILVNNAGITRDKLFMAMKEDDWNEVINVNLNAIYHLTHAFIRPMLKNKGKIINISSVSGLSGNPGQANYSAAKAGLIGMTRTLARELGGKGVTVNCIAPGFITTPMTDKLNEAQQQAILSRIPLKRFGKPEEIAQAALFLATADYITGQTLAVDGGMLA